MIFYIRYDCLANWRNIHGLGGMKMTNNPGPTPRLVEDPTLRNQTRIFASRYQAGLLLAKKLEKYSSNEITVLSIPAGGVPVGIAIAEQLNSEYHLIFSRKIQIPWNPEAGYGAVAPDGNVVLNEPLVRHLGLSEKEIKQHASLVLKEIKRRTKKFLGDIPFPNLDSRIVILTDDGLASGYTMLAAIRAVKVKHPAKIIIAVPTAPLSTIDRILSEIDELVCLNVRDSQFFAVADAYKKWYDLGDQEVTAYLNRLNLREKC